jgi:hypothetical protein
MVNKDYEMEVPLVHGKPFGRSSKPFEYKKIREERKIDLRETGHSDWINFDYKEPYRIFTIPEQSETDLSDSVSRKESKISSNAVKIPSNHSIRSRNVDNVVEVFKTNSKQTFVTSEDEASVSCACRHDFNSESFTISASKCTQTDEVSSASSHEILEATTKSSSPLQAQYSERDDALAFSYYSPATKRMSCFKWLKKICI